MSFVTKVKLYMLYMSIVKEFSAVLPTLYSVTRTTMPHRLFAISAGCQFGLATNSRSPCFAVVLSMALP